MKPSEIILSLLMVFTISSTSVNAQTTVTFQPDASSGVDAELFNCVSCGYSTMNFGSIDEISAIAWTNSGNNSDTRALIAFDLTSIPSNATVTNAVLSLYHNPNPASGNMNGLHSTLSGSNESFLKKVTSGWAEGTVTWANQPTTTNTGQISLPASSSGTQNYLNIDVTAMVQEMVVIPSLNYGFMLQLASEIEYRGVIFASSDHSNANLHPKLEISYTVSNVGVSEELSNEEKGELVVYPNPNNGIFNIAVPAEITSGKLCVMDLEGKVVYEEEFTGDQLLLNLKMNSGIYFIIISDDEQMFNGKLIVE